MARGGYRVRGGVRGGEGEGKKRARRGRGERMARGGACGNSAMSLIGG